MAHQMILFPTFDGQTKSLAAVNVAAIDLIKPGMTPGTSNVYVSGNHGTNCVNVHIEMSQIFDRLKAVGVVFLDLSGGQGYKQVRQDDGH